MMPDRLQSWSELPESARVFVAAVGLAGAGILAYSLPGAVGAHGLEALALAAAAIPASMVKASFPNGLSTLTLGLVLDYLTILVLGPHAAVLVAAVGGWGQSTFRTRLKNPPHQTLFSVAALVCAVFFTGRVYVALGGHPGLWEPSTMFVPLAAAATTFFLLNSGLVAAAIGLTRGESPMHVWSEAFLWIWPSYLLGAGLAVAIFSGVRQGNLWPVAFLAVPLALTIRNLQAYFERERESATDPGTGLANRRHILEYAEREISRATRRGTSLAIVMVDVDDFKAINDLHGHRAGDRALRQVGQCLRQSIRSYDLCARYGGDEFLIVLSDCRPDAVERLAADVRTTVRDLRVESPAGHVSLTVSLGIAVCPQDGENIETLLDVADSRMYRCKLGSRQTAPSSCLVM
jgi:diguanylate cyclase (GGDEF)-like protein